MRGRWELPPGEDAPFLDTNVNVRYGEPEFPNEPVMGKWLRFQRMPGTKTWLRIEKNYDHTWSVLLIPLGVQTWQA